MREVSLMFTTSSRSSKYPMASNQKLHAQAVNDDWVLDSAQSRGVQRLHVKDVDTLELSEHLCCFVRRVLSGWEDQRWSNDER